MESLYFDPALVCQAIVHLLADGLPRRRSEIRRQLNRTGLSVTRPIVGKTLWNPAYYGRLFMKDSNEEWHLIGTSAVTWAPYQLPWQQSVPATKAYNEPNRQPTCNKCKDHGGTYRNYGDGLPEWVTCNRCNLQ